jgi:solute carrier family 25 phosphate transporter 3
MQIDSKRYSSIGTGFKITLAEGGISNLLRGWAPTFIGYSIQGAGKYGLYEYFKQ